MPRSAVPMKEQVRQLYEQHLAKEARRKQQQGLGRPILSAKLNDRQAVFVGNAVYYSTKWKTFPDFLSDYIKNVLAPEWGNTEIAKPFAERHPIIQWYDSYCRYQKNAVTKTGEVYASEVTGVVACYLGLAYSLYLLHHNVELQSRLVRRLKDRGQFQGAYYELFVANALIRAGFKLVLEDETDGANKHCEFSAVSPKSGKKYWVEAKMRSVAGLLGRTATDGSFDPNPLAQLNKHLTQALRKPASDERLIFVDLNTEEDLAKNKPVWAERAERTLERYEKRHPDAKAYVIVTNLPFHRVLDGKVTIAAVPFGLNMPDFNRPGHYRLFDAWKSKKRHADALDICKSVGCIATFPATFDGSLPSEVFGHDANRIVIGETYFFDDIEGGTLGTVTQAIVMEQNLEVALTISTSDGKQLLCKQPMSEGALKEYKEHPETYFGRIQRVGGRVNTMFELFESMMETYAKSKREFLLAELNKRPEPSGFGQYSHEELAALYCERVAAAAWAQMNQKK